MVTAMVGGCRPLATSAMRLRTSGIHPEKHPIKTELERLSLYQDKLQQFVDISKGTSFNLRCRCMPNLKLSLLGKD
ncbi:nuclear nucleic acid-binding protein [Salix suchowensis]|nr:nuclear nucleic acid-binding protein [Salix suchowensis]